MEGTEQESRRVGVRLKKGYTLPNSPFWDRLPPSSGCPLLAFLETGYRLGLLNVAMKVSRNQRCAIRALEIILSNQTDPEKTASYGP